LFRPLPRVSLAQGRFPSFSFFWVANAALKRLIVSHSGALG
jgi:hypothetical protein